VMVESLACGTPVIASPRGSVPEVLEDGVTGILVDSLEEAVSAAQRIGTLSRQTCREMFERRFSASRMTTDYLSVYEQILSRRGPTIVRNNSPRAVSSTPAIALGA
jgi:glycosyltransferase involved in cell wall biosynthesis